MRILAVLLAALVLGLALPGGADPAPLYASADAADLFEFSLEELRQLRVTSASKKPEALSRTASALHVLTHQDLVRSGYTNVAEALRMVPGLQVERVRSSSWSIGSRGFGGTFSNKLLVLIDGRTVYSPLFAGVFWELQDIPIEEIERIEVIRGPGGTLWGANAVNGVINIITRSAEDTPGVAGSALAGTEEQARGYLRWGGEAGETGDVRVSGSFTQRDESHEGDDDWRMGRVQMRYDGEPHRGHRLRVVGGAFDGALDQQGSVPLLSAPWNLAVDEDGHRRSIHALAHWQHALADESEISAQAWYEYSDLEFVGLRELRHTADLEVQHRFRPWARHEVVWGGGLRVSSDDLQDSMTSTLEPDGRTVALFNAFFLDEVSLFDDRLRLAFGTKLEHNEFTSYEFQPRVQASWALAPGQTLWGSVSQAVRTPTRLEDDADLALQTLPPGAFDPTRPALYALESRKTLDAERALALEAGYRFGVGDRFSFDLAGFANRYRDLVSLEPEAPRSETDPVDHVVLPLRLGNDLSGRTWGFEVVGRWQARPNWRLEAWYSHLRMHLDVRDGSLDTFTEAQEDAVPHHQIYLRSALDLGERFHVDAILRGTSRLRSGVPGYVDADLRLAFEPRPGLELSLVGQNLLHDHRREAAGAAVTGVERGVYGLVRWGF